METLLGEVERIARFGVVGQHCIGGVVLWCVSAFVQLLALAQAPMQAQRMCQLDMCSEYVKRAS